MKRSKMVHGVYTTNRRPKLSSSPIRIWSTYHLKTTARIGYAELEDSDHFR